MARFFYMKKNEVYNMILLDTINHKDGKYSAVIFYWCGKKFVAFFPLDGIKKTPRTFCHT